MEFVNVLKDIQEILFHNVHHFSVRAFNLLFLFDFQGDFFLVQIPSEIISPCDPSPCGSNAVCKEKNGAGSCSCISDFFGDPYTGCRPECSQNSDCDRSKACFNQKCKDPCPGVCGNNAQCHVVNHSPSCECLPGYTGNPLSGCREPPKSNNCKKKPAIFSFTFELFYR